RRDADAAEARQLVAGAGTRQHEQGARQARQARGFALDHLEELVPRLAVVLRAGLQHLDRRHDRRERRAQVVCGGGGGLALHALVARTLGLVLDDEDRVLATGGGRDTGDEQRAVAVEQAQVAGQRGGEEVGGELLQRLEALGLDRRLVERLGDTEQVAGAA